MARDARGRESGPASGFTLIELLVVVSIISLMMATMLPSLTRAQKKGEQTHCLGNQHQLQLAWLLYSTSNEDQICRPGTFQSALKSYAPIEETFFCKTAQSQTAGRASADSSYGVSNTMGGEFRDGVHPYLKLHEISQPTDRAVFADREGTASSCYWPLLREPKQKLWLWRPPDLFGVGGISNRHGNGCNMTFADGHGEMIHWKDPRTLGLIKGTFADEVEASENNDDLDYLVRVLVGNRPVQDETEDIQQADEEK